MPANFGSSRSSYKRSHSRRITPDDSMASLPPCINARINHLKTCKRAGVSGDSYMQMVCETRTIILTAITNYPHNIPVETASALISSVVEDADLFDLQDRLDIVDSVNTKLCVTNIEICHSTTPSTTVSVWACVFVRACVLAYMQVPPLW